MRIAVVLGAGAVHAAIQRLRRQVRIAKWIGVAAIAGAALVMASTEAATERWATGIFGLLVAAFCVAVCAFERIVSWALRRYLGPVTGTGVSELVQDRYESVLAEAGIPTGPLGAARIGVEALLRPSSLRRRVDRAAAVIGQRAPELVAELSAVVDSR